MPRTYVIGDLHGRFDLLQQALLAIVKHSGIDEATIVMLGDYVDRGPESRKIIERLMEWTTSRNYALIARLVCLIGNHEEMMLETIRKPLDPDWWIGNGGGSTLMSYGHKPRGKIDLSVVPKEHLDWIAALPYMYTDKHRVYVHAGLNPDVPLEKQTEQYIGQGLDRSRLVTWWRYGKGEQAKQNLITHHIVHGHDQHEDGPLRYQGRTNLDTFAWYTGRLVVGVFDDDTPGGPVDLIEVKGPHQNDT